MCIDYHVLAATKRERITRYMSPLYKDQVKAMLEYQANSSIDSYDETKFYTALKRQYKEHD